MSLSNIHWLKRLCVCVHVYMHNTIVQFDGWIDTAQNNNNNNADDDDDYGVIYKRIMNVMLAYIHVYTNNIWFPMVTRIYTYVWYITYMLYILECSSVCAYLRRVYICMYVFVCIWHSYEYWVCQLVWLNNRMRIYKNNNNNDML